MYSRLISAIIAFTALCGLCQAQVQQRRAALTGGGNQDRGKCTIEVVVDGAAEVEVRGDTASLRNLRGQMPQWRRFECTGPMPTRPADFRFAGVDGRGRQQLVRDPRDGGSAVVQIEDPDNGAEGYTFDLIWNGGVGSYSTNGYPTTSDRNRPEDYSGGRYGQRFSQDDAMRGCQDAVRQQAAQQLNVSERDIAFRRIQADDDPRPGDRVDGVFDLRRGSGRDQAFRFSCAVNFDTGRVWNAQISSFDNSDYRRSQSYGSTSSSERAIRSCQNAVEQRIANDFGARNVAFDSIRFDDRQAGGNAVFGNARAESRGNFPASFTFSCSVDPRDGDVRRVDVQPRR